jgi:hypothetical protein
LAAAAQIELTRSEARVLRLAPEFELLIACSQQAASQSAMALSSILASPLNWDQALRLASQQRVMPTLHSALRYRDDVPGSIRSAICERFKNQERRVLRFTAELARITRQFDHRGIEVLAHKGAALGQFLYGDPAMRQFGDLDFLVRAADIPGARSALTELGYMPKLQLSPRQEREYLRSGYEYVFGLNADCNLVELQWQIVPRFYSISFDMDAMFSRSIDCNLDGMRLRTLGREDLMLVLCVHAAKHEWAQLGMVRDIATLAGLDLDWDWIEAEARQLGTVRILAVSLSLASSLCGLDTSAIPRIQKEISSVTEIAAAIQCSIVAGVEGETESLRYFRRMMELRERWLDRMRVAWRLAATPSVGEWLAVRIPDSVFSFYQGVRMFRLLKRFCFPAKAQVVRASPIE